MALYDELTYCVGATVAKAVYRGLARFPFDRPGFKFCWHLKKVRQCKASEKRSITYSHIPLLKFKTLLLCLEIRIRWNLSFLQHHYSFNQTSQPARTFKVSNIRLDRSNVELARTASILTKDICKTL